jgi:hypothetical protein
MQLWPVEDTKLELIWKEFVKLSGSLRIVGILAEIQTRYFLNKGQAIVLIFSV